MARVQRLLAACRRLEEVHHGRELGEQVGGGPALAWARHDEDVRGGERDAGVGALADRLSVASRAGTRAVAQ
jgi:hypothetical protein